MESERAKVRQTEEAYQHKLEKMEAQLQTYRDAFNNLKQSGKIITEDNFDAKYQESLENIVNYDYALNRSAEVIAVGSVEKD